MLTHMHKGDTHCVYPVEYGQSDGATGALYRKDRVSLSAPDTGHEVTGHWGPSSG